MTELKLYRYIDDNNIEWHWDGDDVLIFPYYFQIKDFMDLLGASAFDDDGILCVMKHNYFAIYMKDMCENYDIDIETVFPKKDEEK